MVETALVIFALLTLTLGLVQFGLVYNAILTLNNLAREGSRFAAVRANDLANEPLGREELTKQVAKELTKRAKGTAIEPGSFTTAGLRIEATSLRSNSSVRVIITYNMIANKSFIPNLLPLPANLARYEASATNLIE